MGEWLLMGTRFLLGVMFWNEVVVIATEHVPVLKTTEFHSLKWLKWLGKFVFMYSRHTRIKICV